MVRIQCSGMKTSRKKAYKTEQIYKVMEIMRGNKTLKKHE